MGDNYYRQEKNAAGEVVEQQHGDVAMFTRSEATDIGARIDMSGRPKQGEEGVHGVCVRLANALSARTGETWTADPAGPVGPEDGVDWYLRSGFGGVWGVQVTRVGSRSRWEQCATGKPVAEEVPAAVAALEIWEAIARKLKIRGGILALDIGQPGMHAFGRTLEAFRDVYGEDTHARVRFSQVWLVGYSLETTVRLHP
jgi:hypothetical protein